MGYRLRQIAAESKFSSALQLEAIGQAVPMSEIKAALQESGVQEVRECTLSMVVVVLLIIAMHIYTRLSLGEVLGQIARGLRFIWPNPDYAVLRDSAISYRRYQLGARPLVNLFHRVCRPLARPETPGAFMFGLRLMAIDGTVEDVPDTSANVKAFGRHTGPRGDSALPQVQGV
ncbi:MAG: transposase domain-containing protein [Anaerolineae bacterium]|nr:transposase domain-containing protein [Anaerolineae bacterium]